MAKRNTFSEDEIYDEKFDINQVKGGKIIVENAKDGEVFTTLDGTESACFIM